MKETEFIAKNKDKWEKFEDLYSKKDKDPEQLTELFIEITNDLSYAKTNYEKRTVRVYLNQLAQKVFSSFYLKKKTKPQFWKFWKTTLPLELYRSRYNMLAGLVVFIVAALIGIISQEYDHNFFRIIAGDGYVDQTIQRIANGDPLGIYGTSGEAFTFTTILFNNLQVTTLVFVAGIFFSVGTYFLMLTNGIMVGSFQWFFKTQGILLTSFLGIWIHGAFEISAIIIAGGAGITLGNGLLFPGTLSRKDALINSGKRGLRIMLGALVLIVFAAFFEGYLTRHYNSFSTLAKAAFIILCFSIVIFYFVIYPFIVARKAKKEDFINDEIPAFEEIDESPYIIRTSGQIFVLSFNLYKKYIKPYLVLFSITVLPFVGIQIFWSYYNYWNFFDNDLYWFENLRLLTNTSVHENYIGQIITLFSITIATLNVGYVYHHSKIKISQWFNYIGPRLFPMFMIVLILFSIFSRLNVFMILLSLLLTPFLIGAIGGVLNHKKFYFSNIAKGFKTASSGYIKFLGVQFILVLITVVFFQILAGFGSSSPAETFEMPDVLDSIFSELIKIHTATLFDDYYVYIQIMKSIFFLAFLFLIIPLWCYNIMYVQFSEDEKNEAVGLQKEIEKFGTRSNFYEQPQDFES